MNDSAETYDKEFLALLRLIYQPDSLDHADIKARLEEEEDLRNSLADTQAAKDVMGFATMDEHLAWLDRSFQSFEGIIQAGTSQQSRQAARIISFTSPWFLAAVAGVGLFVLFVLFRPSPRETDYYKTLIVEADRHPFLNETSRLRAKSALQTATDTLEQHIQQLYKQKKYEQIIQEIDQWNRQAGRDSLTFAYHKAFALWAMGDRIACILSFQQIIRSPSHSRREQSMLCLALVYWEGKETGKTRILLEEILDSPTGHPRLKADAQRFLDQVLE